MPWPSETPVTSGPSKNTRSDLARAARAGEHRATIPRRRPTDAASGGSRFLAGRVLVTGASRGIGRAIAVHARRGREFDGRDQLPGTKRGGGGDSARIVREGSEATAALLPVRRRRTAPPALEALEGGRRWRTGPSTASCATPASTPTAPFPGPVRGRLGSRGPADEPRRVLQRACVRS